MHYRSPRRVREHAERLLKEIMAENLSNLKKDITIQVQETKGSKQDKHKDIHPRHIVVNLSKAKDKERRIFKRARE